jgi:ABC-type phosphate transport system auxiliary subunit
MRQIAHEMDSQYLHDREIQYLHEHIEGLEELIDSFADLKEAEHEKLQQRYDSLLAELHRMEDWWEAAICYVQLLGGKLHEYPLGDMTEEERVRQLAEYEERWQLN